MESGLQRYYVPVPGWGATPAHIRRLDVPDVAVDSRDRVYLLTREDPGVLVLDQDGTFLRSWGEGLFSTHPHGISVGPDDTVYIVDEGHDSVRSYSPSGEEIMSFGPSRRGGERPRPDLRFRLSPVMTPSGPYNRPTKAAVAADGTVYVSDGYGNCRVHMFDRSGAFLGSWGTPGVGPAQFHLPHGLAVAPDGRVFVADRENDRIQIFSAEGRYLGEWDDLRRPSGLCLKNGLAYVAELPSPAGYRTWRHGIRTGALRGRVSIFDLHGRLQWRSEGGEDPCAADGFTAPHGIAADSSGAVYVAEVTWTAGGRLGEFPLGCHSLVKLRPRL